MRQHLRLPARLGLLLILFATLSLRSNAAPVGQITVQATTEGLVQNILDEIVFSNISTKIGSDFNPATLSKDIRTLVGTKRFEDVRTTVETAADGKVNVTFIVTPKPIVRNILIQGNKKFKTARLQKLITHEVAVPVDETTLAADRNAILDKYRNAGHFGTEVTTLQAPVDAGGVNVTFVIQEKPRYKLQRVEFEGNTAFTGDELRAAIVTKREWWRYIFRFGNYFNEQQLILDRDKLKEVYGTKGYMDFTITDIEKTYDAREKWVTLTFKMIEGQQYTISDITVTGAKLFTPEYLLGKIKSAPGAIHDSSLESFDTNVLKAEYERLGYLDLRLYPVHQKDIANRKVAIEFRVQEGTPSHIRNIEITGNDLTREKVILRELAIHSSDLGDAGKIRISKSRLENLGYFETVDILPVATEVPGLKDLRIDLKEKPTGQVSLGAGYSSEDSVIGFVEFTESNFDLSRLFNWPPKGAGQRFRTRVQLGSEVSNFTISHVEPWLFDRRLELGTDLFLRNRFEDEYDQRNIGGGMMLSWPIAFKIGPLDEKNWRMGVGFRLEQIEISDVEEFDDSDLTDSRDFVQDHVLADEEDDYWVGRLILRLSRDTRDSFRFPTRGSLFSFQTELVTSALGSYESYARFYLSGTKYITVVRDIVLKLSADYSTLSNDDAAIFDRFFGGGIGSVRGFKRRDISPIDCYEAPLGGRSMLTGTVEILKPVKDFMYVSAFVDAGNVWWDTAEFDLGDLNVSVGLGIQFKALPISLYYGIPVSTSYDHLDGKSGRFHFSIGYTY